MRSWYTRILLALIFLALVANLFTGGQLTEGGRWQWIVAAGGAVFGVVIHLMGILYVTRIRRKRERSSLLWARRGFAVGLTLVLVLAADTFLGDEKSRWIVSGLWMGGALMGALSAAPFFLMLTFQRDAARLVARTGTSSRRRSSE